MFRFLTAIRYSLCRDCSSHSEPAGSPSLANVGVSRLLVEMGVQNKEVNSLKSCGLQYSISAGLKSGPDRQPFFFSKDQCKS